MKNKQLIFAFLFLAVCFSDCKKYSEDSRVPHLESAKWRLAGGGSHSGAKVWVSTGFASGSTIAFGRTGNFGGTFAPFNFWNTKWDFIDKREKLKITDDKGVAFEYTIVKLDNDALWLKNDSAVFEFKSKKY